MDYQSTEGCMQIGQWLSDISQWLTNNDKLVTGWTAIAALFVSSVSIILAFCGLMTQRRHDRKSVQPIGHISVGDYENEIFVRLRNDGVGPMIVRVSRVRDSLDGRTEISIVDFMPELPDGYLWKTFVGDMRDRA